MSVGSIGLTNDQGEATLIYRRGDSWTDHATLLSAVQLQHPITSLHIVDSSACRRVLGCLPSGLLLLGDATGKVHVLSSEVPLATLQAPTTNAAVAALVSFASSLGGALGAQLLIVAGHADGNVAVYNFDFEGGAANLLQVPLVRFTEASPSGPLTSLAISRPSLGSSSGVVATLAAMTAGGQVHIGRLRLAHPATESSLTWLPLAASAEGMPRAVALATVKGVVNVFYADGSQGKVAVRGPGGGARIVPWRPCHRWTATDTNAPSQAVVGAVYGDSTKSAAASVYAIMDDGSVRVTAALGNKGQACAVAGSTNADGMGRQRDILGKTTSLAAVPGYLLATTADQHIVVVNVTAQGLRSSPSVVLQQQLEALAASIPGASRRSWWFQKSVAASELGFPLQITAEGGRVLIQVQPRLVALYESSLPFKPASQPLGGGNISLMLKILHPLLLAVGIGLVIHRAKQRRQSTAATPGLGSFQSFDEIARSRRMGLAADFERSFGADKGMDRYQKWVQEDVDDDVGEDELAKLLHQAAIDRAPGRGNSRHTLWEDVTPRNGAVERHSTPLPSEEGPRHRIRGDPSTKEVSVWD